MKKVKVTRVATFEYVVDRTAYQGAPDDQIIAMENSEDVQYYGIVEGFADNFVGEEVTVEFVDIPENPEEGS